MPETGDLLVCSCGSDWWVLQEQQQISLPVARGSAGRHRAPAERTRLVQACAECGKRADEVLDGG